MNKVILIGRITKEPEIKYTPSGAAFCVFSLAVDRDYKDESGNTPTDFISCVSWRSQAEFIGNWIKKGYLIAITGNLQVRSYETNNGDNKIVTQVIVENVQNLTPKDNNKPQTKPNQNSNVKVNGQNVDFVQDDDNLPF